MMQKLMENQWYQKLMKLLENKFLKYLIVGASSTIIDTVIFGVEVKLLGINPLIAKIPSQAVSITNGYYWNRKWTFKNTSKEVRKQFIKFVIISLVGTLLSLLCLYVFINLFHFEEIFSNILTAFVILFWNFNINRIFTFK